MNRQRLNEMIEDKMKANRNLKIFYYYQNILRKIKSDNKVSKFNPLSIVIFQHSNFS
jgi:hypothetical protein